MNAAELYWTQLYAQAELEADDDDTAAPAQDSELGRRYYWVDEDVDS